MYLSLQRSDMFIEKFQDSSSAPAERYVKRGDVVAYRAVSSNEGVYNVFFAPAERYVYRKVSRLLFRLCDA